MELQGRAGKADQECLHWTQQGWRRGRGGGRGRPLMEYVRSFPVRGTPSFLPSYPSAENVFVFWKKLLLLLETENSLLNFQVSQERLTGGQRQVPIFSRAQRAVWPKQPMLDNAWPPPRLPPWWARGNLPPSALQVTLNGAKLSAHHMLWALMRALDQWGLSGNFNEGVHLKPGLRWEKLPNRCLSTPAEKTNNPPSLQCQPANNASSILVCTRCAILQCIIICNIMQGLPSIVLCNVSYKTGDCQRPVTQQGKWKWIWFHHPKVRTHLWLSFIHIWASFLLLFRISTCLYWQ